MTLELLKVVYVLVVLIMYNFMNHYLSQLQMDGCDDCTGRIHRPVKLHSRINMGHHDLWFAMKPTSAFLLYVFLFFFFFQPTIVDFVNYEQYICVLFTVPQITLFSNIFIKNGSHNTIYTFENYFATVFSVSTKISSIQTHPSSKIF